MKFENNDWLTLVIIVYFAAFFGAFLLPCSGDSNSDTADTANDTADIIEKEVQTKHVPHIIHTSSVLRTTRIVPAG